MLTTSERSRYARHLILPQIGEEGQEKLKGASVLIVGAGGLGSPVALYLAAAGVGRIGLVDFDRVDLSNLQRQILHGSAAIGSSKIGSARDRLRDINPNVHVESHETRLTSANALEIAREPSVVDAQTLAAFYVRTGRLTGDALGKQTFETEAAHALGRTTRERERVGPPRGGRSRDRGRPRRPRGAG